MPSTPVPAAAAGLPEVTMDDTLLRVQDDLDETRNLVTAAYMAGADLEVEEGNPLRTLLALVEDRLKDVSTRLNVIRGAPERAASDMRR
jgi:hypothetical protein